MCIARLPLPPPLPPYRVPIYALTAWASLISVESAYYLDTLRDVYEAFVIYCFVSLLIAYFGGERAFLLAMHDRNPTPLFWPASLLRKDLDLSDPYDYLFLKRGILQYVLVKPVLAAATMLMKSLGVYHDGNWGLADGYLWTQLVYNMSVSLSLYCLVVFYMATREALSQWNPLPKFLCVKAIVFFSYWQGLGISIMVGLGLIHDTSTLSADHIATFLQSWLICLEMIGGAFGHWISFSHLDYVPMFELAGRVMLFHALRDALGFKDVYIDAKSAWSGHLYTYTYFDPRVPVDELDTQMPVPAPQRRRTLSRASAQTDGDAARTHRASRVGSGPHTPVGNEGDTPDQTTASLHSSDSTASLASSVHCNESASQMSGTDSNAGTASLADHPSVALADPPLTGNPIKERRLRAGMRYTQGGKKTYWLPVEPIDHRAAALAAGGAGQTRARLFRGDHNSSGLRAPIEYIGSSLRPSRIARESRRVQRYNDLEAPRDHVSTSVATEHTRLLSGSASGHRSMAHPSSLAKLSMDIDSQEFACDDALYAEARGVEGDFNYPVMELGVAVGYGRRRPYGNTLTRRRSVPSGAPGTGARPRLLDDQDDPYLPHGSSEYRSIP
ncbi:DUF300-domain-containing protein [Martensiomyces pterosporus]|nr:DUF300-domain-containing protein [Martensiomyces pterosporus]